jgi:hypothetical protein
MPSIITLKPTALHGLGEPPQSDGDLCAHSPVDFRIGGDRLLSPEDGDWTVSASAVYLFRTLERQHNNTTAAAVNRLHVTVDGSATRVAQFACTNSSTNYNMANQYVAAGLGSGSHTIKLQFSCNAGTAAFSHRSISVWRKGSPHMKIL